MLWRWGLDWLLLVSKVSLARSLSTRTDHLQAVAITRQGDMLSESNNHQQVLGLNDGMTVMAIDDHGDTLLQFYDTTSIGIICDTGQCITIPNNTHDNLTLGNGTGNLSRFSGVGNEVCCPSGQIQYGDGSACMGGSTPNCKMFGNPALPLCPTVSVDGASLCSNGRTAQKQEKVDCDASECTFIPNHFQGAGNRVCCPTGEVKYGDGSACKSASTQPTGGNPVCKVYGNPGMPLCSSVSSNGTSLCTYLPPLPTVEKVIICDSSQCTTIPTGHPGAGNQACCPVGQTQIGDGSVCEGDSKPNCKIFGSPGLELCSTVATNGTSLCTGLSCAAEQCQTIPSGFPSAGKQVCCPTGQIKHGDGSACEGGVSPLCKFYGNPALPRCSTVAANGTSMCMED